MKNRHLLIVLFALLMPLAMWGQKTLPYEYGFENNDLASEGWTRNSLASSTAIKEGAKRTGEYGFQFYYNDAPQYLISPELTGTSNGVSVEFYYKNSSTYFPRTFQVGYSTNTTAVGDFTFGDEITASNAEWTNFSQTFVAGTKFIAIMFNNTSFGNLYLDDFVFEAYSAYPKPRNLAMTDCTSRTATLDWTARTGQDHWDIYYTKSTTAPTESTTPQVMNTAIKPNTITGLDPGDTYYAYVRGNYNNGEHYSDWSDACTFEVGCFTPTGFEVQVASDMAGLIWTPAGGESEWQVVYSTIQGFDPEGETPVVVNGSNSFVMGGQIGYQLDNLVSGTTYYARVRANCGDGYSEWTEEYEFTPYCIAPSDLTVIWVNHNSAKFRWNPGAAESEWQLVYSDDPDFDPDAATPITVESLPYTLEGLTTNTTYYAYIRAACSSTDHSAWSNKCSFTPIYSVTVYDGMYASDLPIDVYYVNYLQKNQYIIPSSSLEELTYGYINELVYFVPNTTVSWNDANAEFEVYLGEMEASSFSDNTGMPWLSMSLAYSGHLSIDAGVMTIVFSEPYQYQGDNLVIGFKETVAGSGGRYLSWEGDMASSSLGLYDYNGSGYYPTSIVPKTAIHYTPGTAPTCPRPKDLVSSNVGQTSATLSWTNGGTETAWVLQYATDATFTQNVVNVNVSENPYNLTGLTSETIYYARVKASCGGGDFSSWSNMCSFMPSAIAEITINDGTETNANVPFRSSDASTTNVKSQFIIPASELTNVAGNQITKMTFYNETTTASWPNGVFYVYLASTEMTEFASGTPVEWSTLTNVYGGSLSVADHKMEVVFATPYLYTGGNLLVAFDEAVQCSSAGYWWWLGVNTENYAALSYNGYYYQRQFLPTMTITYDTSPAPTCVAPTNLHIGYTSNTAALSWTAGDEETLWKLQYKVASDANWSEVVTIENTPSYSLGNLTASTDYVIRVQSDCVEGGLSNWLVKSFTTRCAPESLPFAYNFDNDAAGANMPQCWMRINLVAPTTTYADRPRIVSSSSNSHSTQNYLEFVKASSSYAPLYQMAVLPEMDAPVNTLILSFWAKISSTASTNRLAVGVMTDPDDVTTFVKVSDVPIASTTYTEYSVNFENYEGSGRYIAISCDGGSVTRTIYVDDISIVVDNTCKVPENLEITNITTNSAVFTWTAGSNVTNWQVQYKKSSDTDWSESIAVNGTASYTFNNLLVATQYDARVRTNCDNDNFSEWASTSFTTDCDYMSLPYSYGFEDDEAGAIAPSCWHFSGGYYPRIDSGSAHSGTKCLLIDKNSNNAVNYVVFPEINTAVTPINTLQVAFWGKRFSSEVYQYSYFDYFSLGVMTDPNDVSTFEFITGTSMNMSNKEYKLFELYLDNCASQGTYLALRYTGEPMYYIDDIEISVAPTCRQPLDLSSDYTYAHEANIKWKTRDLRQCNYQVSYSTNEGFDPDNGTIVDVEFATSLVNAGTPYRDYMLPCLDANTTYYFYVRANCGNGDFSEWSDDYASFITQEACPAPEDFGACIIQNTSATLQWNGDLDANWEFRYKKTSDEEWITPASLELLSGEGSELRYRIENLETGVEYIAQLRRHCGVYSCPAVDDGYSDWATYTFITSEGCQTPSAWMCLTQMGTSAKLEWNQVGEENYWQIRYRLSTENDYPAGNIVLTDYMPEARKQQWTITGLQPNSMYYWQVRAYCDDENQSNWSNERYFFTGGEKITVDKAHPFYEDFEGTSGMPAGWMRCNQYNYDLNYFYPWSFTLAEEPAWDERPGNHAIYNNSDDYHGSTSVLTPEMYIDENATSVMLSFNDYCDFSPSAISGQLMSYGSMQVMVSTNHGETYDYVWWSCGPKRYWRQHFVDLEEYIDQDIIIRIDYWWALTQPNFDWYVDDVRVQVFDKVGGGNTNVTEGEWNSGDFWGGSVPDSGDDVIINANVTIPEGVVAEANQIVINTDTTYVNGNRAMKFGKLTIADGGQLKVNNAVKATVEKNITGYGNDNHAQNGWYFIASPVNESDFAPEMVNNMLSNTYDLYRLNPSNAMWENYRVHNDPNDANPFLVLDNGKGYLYANSSNVTLSFTGEVKPYSPSDNTVSIVPGWNLIGNPFTRDVTIDQPYSTLTEQNNVQSITNGQGAIHPCQGVAVYNDGSSNRDVTFLLPSTSTAPSNQIHIALTEPQTRGVNIDNAIVSFDEGSALPKFQFGDQNANIYFPQRGKEYAIVSAEAHGELPLNFKARENGTYTLNFSGDVIARSTATKQSNMTGFSYLHLIDNLTGVDVDLLVEPSYTFTAKTNDYASRFKLVFFAQVSDQEDDDFAFISNGNIIVNGEGIVQIIDMTGHVVASYNANNRFGTDGFAAGVYVLRLINGENTKTQKIIIK